MCKAIESGAGTVQNATCLSIGDSEQALYDGLRLRDSELTMQSLDNLYRAGLVGRVVDALDAASDEGLLENGPFLAAVAVTLCSFSGDPKLKAFGLALSNGYCLCGPTAYWQRYGHHNHAGIRLSL